MLSLAIERGNPIWSQAEGRNELQVFLGKVSQIPEIPVNFRIWNAMKTAPCRYDEISVDPLK